MLVAVAAGGAAGTALRYELARELPASAAGFPWTSFGINVGGAFALGVILTLVLERWPPTRYVRPLLAIGFLGAFTTLSTLAVESDLRVKDGNSAIAAAYAAASVAAGLTAAYVGIVSGRMGRRPR